MDKSLNKIPSKGSFDDFEWSFQSDNSILILKKSFFRETGNDLEIGMCNLNGLDFNDIQNNVIICSEILANDGEVFDLCDDYVYYADSLFEHFRKMLNEGLDTEAKA